MEPASAKRPKSRVSKSWEEAAVVERVLHTRREMTMVSVRGSFALLISIRTIGGVRQSISKPMPLALLEYVATLMYS